MRAPRQPPTRYARWALWCALALPALLTVGPVMGGSLPIRHAIASSGALAAQLLVVALAIGPLASLFPRTRPARWLLAHRRAFGVAALCYALLHMVVFAIGIGRLDHIVQGLAFASMWTGWLALLLLLPLGLTSSNLAMRVLGRNWKRLHRLAYPAAGLVLAHWLFLTRTPLEALGWFAVPIALIGARLYVIRRSREGKPG